MQVILLISLCSKISKVCYFSQNFMGALPPNPPPGPPPQTPATAQSVALRLTSLAFFWSLAVLRSASQLWEFLLPWKKNILEGKYMYYIYIY